MKAQTPNIAVVRSVWRRVKKAKIRGLEIHYLGPVKDVKGGGGVTDQSKPITGSTETTDSTSTLRYVPKKNQVRSDTQGTSSSPYGIMWPNATANAIAMKPTPSRTYDGLSIRCSEMSVKEPPGVIKLA